MRKGSSAGFSLIEVLVVVSIMVILSGIAAPQFLHHIERARMAKDMQTLHMVYEGVVSALMENDVYEEVAGAGFASPVRLSDLDGALKDELEAIVGDVEEIRLESAAAKGSGGSEGEIYIDVRMARTGGGSRTLELSVYCSTDGAHADTGLGVVGTERETYE